MIKFLINQRFWESEWILEFWMEFWMAAILPIVCGGNSEKSDVNPMNIHSHWMIEIMWCHPLLNHGSHGFWRLLNIMRIRKNED
jgi:hypothetical protein